MNILFVSPTSDYAGIDVCLEMLVNGINRDNFKPIVVFPLESILKKKLDAYGVKCYRLPLYWWFPTGFCGRSIIDIIPTMRAKVDSLVHIIKDNKIDLVFTNTTVTLDGAIAAGIVGVPHIYHVHAPFVDNIYTKMSHESRRFIYQLMGKMSYRLVCCSKLLHEHMSTFVSNSCYIFNGVDTDKYVFKKRNLLKDDLLKMVSFGHLNSNKRQEFVIESLSILNQIDVNLCKRVRYNIVGMGEAEYVKKLKDLVVDYGLEEQVIIEPFRDDINEYINTFSIYVNSSETESLPLAVLEAMASGMPTLASPNSGTLQLVVDGQTGFIAETPRLMALRIVDLLSRPYLIEEMSEKARQRAVSHFSKDKYIESFEALFSEAIAHKGATCDSQFTKNAYETLTEVSLERCSKKKVLVICPDYSIPTYHIVARIPLDYLCEHELVEYRVLTPIEISIQDIATVDVVYCIRCFDDYSYNVLRISGIFGIPFVFYTDDNYFALKYEGESVIHADTDNSAYKRMFVDSDCVIVNSGDLFFVSNNLNVNSVRLPTYQIVPSDLNSVFMNRSAEIVRIGFMGTLKREGDFAFVTPALKRILSEFRGKVSMEFIGFCPEELRDDPDVHTFPFIGNYDEFRSFFESRAWDIGLAPLAITRFNESKTNNKYREYSALGIAGVYSDISTYNYCVVDGETGLIVENSQEAWYNAIKRLIEDENLRQHISLNSHKDIIENYRLDTFAKCLFSVFERCCDAKKLSLDGNPHRIPCIGIEKLKQCYASREPRGSVLQSQELKEGLSQSEKQSQFGGTTEALKDLFARLLARIGFRKSKWSRLFGYGTDLWQCLSPVFGDIENFLMQHRSRRHNRLLQLTDSFHKVDHIDFRMAFNPGTLNVITCVFTTGTAQEALVRLELFDPKGNTACDTLSLISLADPNVSTSFDVGNVVIHKESKWLIRLSVLSPWPVYSYEIVSRHLFGLLRRSVAPFVKLTYREGSPSRQEGLETSSKEMLEDGRRREEGMVKHSNVQEALRSGRFCASFPGYVTLQAFAEQYLVPRTGKWKLGLSPDLRNFPYLEYFVPRISLGFESVLIGVGPVDHDPKGRIGIEIVSSKNVIVANVTVPLQSINPNFPVRFVLPEKIQLSSRGDRIRVFVSNVLSSISTISIIEIQSQSLFNGKMKTFPYLSLE